MEHNYLTWTNHVSFIDPKPGTLVDMVRVKKVGPFILGPVLGNSPVKSIVQYLARQEKTDKFFTVKVCKYCRMRAS